MAEDIETTIDTNAQGPKAVTVDGTTVTAHPLPDQIAADKYLTRKAARTDLRKAFCRVKLVPPGTV